MLVIARHLASVSSLFATLLLAAGALANSAEPQSIRTRVTGNSVEVCESRLCDADRAPKENRILRQDVKTGETVVVPLHCTDSKCVLDECVPPGEYRYGDTYSWYTDCYPIAAATVTAAPAADCAPSLGPERPVKSAAAAPWGDAPDPRSCGGGYGCLRCAAPGLGESGAGVIGANAIALLAGVLLFARRRRQR